MWVFFLFWSVVYSSKGVIYSRLIDVYPRIISLLNRYESYFNFAYSNGYEYFIVRVYISVIIFKLNKISILINISYQIIGLYNWYFSILFSMQLIRKSGMAKHKKKLLKSHKSSKQSSDEAVIPKDLRARKKVIQYIESSSDENSDSDFLGFWALSILSQSDDSFKA